MNRYIVIQGGGDLASGVAHRLKRCGMNVIVTEIAHPLAVRRTVSFAQAVLDGKAEIEGVIAGYARNFTDIMTILARHQLPVTTIPLSEVLDYFRPDVLVNATMAKKNIDMKKNLAPLTIALGPGYRAGQDVDVVVETQRGHYLGRLIYEGAAAANTGIPGIVMGYGAERVLRAPVAGTLRQILDIGVSVTKGEDICTVDEHIVKASISGVIRGLIMDGCQVKKGWKIGDIDPRNNKDFCYTISEKARAIGGAVLEAILHYQWQEIEAKHVDAIG